MKADLFYLLFILLILAQSSDTSSQSFQDPSSKTISFTKSTQNFPPAETFQVKLGDVDSDGDLDAVFPNMGFNNSKIWLNDGSGYFTDSGQLLTQQGHGVGLEDLDNDGSLNTDHRKFILMTQEFILIRART